MNNAKRLPDAYNKDTNSNLYKLLQLANLVDTDFKCDLKAIDGSKDLSFAYGKTLDRYGEMAGQARNGMSDTQYRVKILNRIATLLSSSDCNSVIELVANMLEVDASEIYVHDYGDSSGLVSVEGITIEMVEQKGYSAKEVLTMINDILPVGVKLTHTVIEGTLEMLGDVMIVFPEYPTLYEAWAIGQRNPNSTLSGYGENPIDSSDNGTFEGGTLSSVE